MAGSATNFPYVLARIHARQSARADQRLWARLMPYRDFRGYLAALRQTPLAKFAEGLPQGADAHDVERHFRTTWHAYVLEIADWHGTDFKDAVVRLADVTDIPVRRYLARGGPVQAWMPAGTGFGNAEGPAASAGADFRAWCDDFSSALPDPVLRRHVVDTCGRLRALERGGIPQIEDLRAFCERWFRTAGHPFFAVLAHIGCVACDLMELRGALCVRLLFQGDAALEGVVS